MIVEYKIPDDVKSIYNKEITDKYIDKTMDCRDHEDMNKEIERKFKFLIFHNHKK